MTKVTVDTNIIPADDIIEICKKKGYECACISVSNREIEGTSFEKDMKVIPAIHEYALLDEARFGQSRFHGKESSMVLQDILYIISNGSFPEDRRNLSDGHRRMLRDAIILQTHITDRRDIFITDDKRGFIKGGLRQRLENKFNTRILTREEFIKGNS